MFGFCNIKLASFVIDSFNNIKDVIVHHSYSVQPFFCSRREEVLVVDEVHDACIKPVETSIWGEFVGSGR